jgi:hypothetical protein
MFIDGVPTFTAATALEARRMVKINTGATDVAPAQIKYCGATGIPQAVTQYSLASGEKGAVDLFPQKEGTFEVEVTISTAINVGTTLYAAASGKLSDHQTTNSYAVAMAIQQAAASNDHIQVLPLPNAMYSNS